MLKEFKHLIQWWMFISTVNLNNFKYSMIPSFISKFILERWCKGFNVQGFNVISMINVYLEC